MITKSFLYLTTLFLLAIVCSANLKPTSLTLDEVITLHPSQTIKLLIKEQDQLYQKVLRDYLNTFVKSTSSSESSNRLIFDKITSESIFNQLKNFMIETLFVKFEMNTLSESFGAEIRQFPDNYFLTFEMYDLLHD